MFAQEVRAVLNDIGRRLVGLRPAQQRRIVRALASLYEVR